MTNNYKPFDLEAALRGEPLVTRDGRKVSYFHQSAPLCIKCPYSAYIENDERISGYFPDGKYRALFESDDDIFMAPKPKKKLWICVSKKSISILSSAHYTTEAFGSKEELEKDLIAYPDRIIAMPGTYEIVEIEIEEEISRLNVSNVSTAGFGGDTSGPIGNFRAVEWHTFGASGGGGTGTPTKIITEFNKK